MRPGRLPRPRRTPLPPVRRQPDRRQLLGVGAALVELLLVPGQPFIALVFTEDPQHVDERPVELGQARALRRLTALAGAPNQGAGREQEQRQSSVDASPAPGRGRERRVRRVHPPHHPRLQPAVAGDVEALADMVALAADVESAIRGAVIGLREFGYSWQDIADRLKVSRQAAQQRWGAR